MGLTPHEGLTVVKIGGSLLEDAALRERALEAIAARVSSGGPVVVVHGGGKRIDKTLAALHIPKRVASGLRVTDDDTLEVVVSILAGLVNKSLVAELRRRGVLSAGLSGVDGETLWAEFHPQVDGVDLGNVGRVVFGNPALLNAMLGAGMLPVLASVAAGRDGALLNVNADAAASAVAVELHATQLVYFTDVEGLLDESGKVVEKLDLERARRLLASPVVTGGMRPKLQACLDAIRAGVKEVVIAGPARHATVLSDGKGGTSLVAA